MVIRIRIKLLARSTVCFLAVLLLSACAGNGSRVPASACTPSQSEDSQYIIGPGDLLNIVVWRNSELSASIPVRPDGRISTPLVDDMDAAGKTPSQLAADMETVLGEYLRSPEVSVIVSGQGAANQIQVIGHVVSPKTLSHRDGLRILDVVVAVGGLSEFAAGNRSYLVRPLEGDQIECRIRIEDLLRGDLSDNIQVFPGDVLVIPETRF